MLRRKALVLSVMMLLVIAFCLATTALAEDAASTYPSGSSSPAEIIPPTGAGPLEVTAEMSVAPVGVITQRGHVNNVCEAQLMTLDEIKRTGAVGTVGDYRIGYFLRAPEGGYKMNNGKLAWEQPADNLNTHIDVVVMDSLTSMPIPLSPLKLDVVDQTGKVVDSHILDYVWTPMGEHFGSNFAIPCAGSYTLRLSAPAPTFVRRDCQMGNRFTVPLNAQFSCVQLTPMKCTEPVGAGPSSTCSPDSNTCPATQPCEPNGTSQ